MPAPIQAIFFKKILRYVKAFEKHKVDQLKIYVVGSGPDLGVVAALKKRGFPVTRVKGSRFGTIPPRSVVYVYPDADHKKLRKTCKARLLLSVAGSSQLVARGEAAVAVGLRSDGRPEIVVNLPRLKSDGHRLPASLLAISRTIR